MGRKPRLAVGSHGFPGPRTASAGLSHSSPDAGGASGSLLTVQSAWTCIIAPFSFVPFIESSIITHISIILVNYLSYGSYASRLKYISSVYDPPEASSPGIHSARRSSPADPCTSIFAPDLLLQSSPHCRSARADRINPALIPTSLVQATHWETLQHLNALPTRQ